VTALVDARGCLTDAGIASLRAAEPGRARPELSSHLASCARCQERILAMDSPGHRKPGPPAKPPALGRTLFLMALVLGAVLIALASMRYLVGR
jgi:hypothetical protein